MDFTLHDKKKEAEKVRNALKVIEDNIAIDEIIRVRSGVISQKNKDNALSEKTKELDKLEKKINKKKNVFSKLSSSSIKEKKERIEVLRKEIIDIENKHSFTRKYSTDHEPVDTN